jgi:hypothetical protein
MTPMRVTLADNSESVGLAAHDLLYAHGKRSGRHRRPSGTRLVHVVHTFPDSAGVKPRTAAAPDRMRPPQVAAAADPSAPAADNAVACLIEEIAY